MTRHSPSSATGIRSLINVTVIRSPVSQVQQVSDISSHSLFAVVVVVIVVVVVGGGGGGVVVVVVVVVVVLFMLYTLHEPYSISGRCRLCVCVFVHGCMFVCVLAYVCACVRVFVCVPVSFTGYRRCSHDAC